ncbi:hypothetical protein GH714_040434 [Hevea brasiliensis]|uniref:Uncharacterized protein n=1 Tax=Hevea brasiliensis TaxID=3981 RepID=A0A6A6MU61_HEVBR|nr:hypothetical protein GH714_040434 [Hevea brasiliensis]
MGEEYANCFTKEASLKGKDSGIPLRTFKNKIDVYDGLLTMESDYEICRFSIFDAMTYHNDVLAICYLDVIDECVNEMFELSDEDPLKVALCHELENQKGSLPLVKGWKRF